MAHATAAAPEERFPDRRRAGRGARAARRRGDAAGGRRNRLPALRRPGPARARALPGVRRLGRGGRHAGVPRREPGASARRATALRLEEVLHGIGSDAARAAAGGERPLFRVSRAGMPRLVEELERRELGTRPVPLGRAPLPGKAWVLAGARADGGRDGRNGGAADAAVDQPGRGHARPARRAAGRAHAARGAARARTRRCRRRSSARWWRRWSRCRPAPRGACSPTSCAAAARCSRRFARGRSARAGGRARPSWSRPRAARRATWPTSTRTSARFERQRERFVAASAERLDALSRCERTRDGLVQRLLEAMTAVARLRTQQAELAGESDPTLGELAARAGSRGRGAGGGGAGAGGAAGGHEASGPCPSAGTATPVVAAGRVEGKSPVRPDLPTASPACPDAPSPSAAAQDLFVAATQPLAATRTACRASPYARAAPRARAAGSRQRPGPLACHSYDCPLAFPIPRSSDGSDAHSSGAVDTHARAPAQLRVSALRQRGRPRDRGARRGPRRRAACRWTSWRAASGPRRIPGCSGTATRTRRGC